MTQYEIVLKVLNDELTIGQANAELRKLHGVTLSKRNLPTISEMEANVADADPTKCTGVGFMDHGIGDCEKIYVENGVLDQDVGFYVTDDQRAPRAYFTILSKDVEATFRCDGDKIVVKK